MNDTISSPEPTGRALAFLAIVEKADRALLAEWLAAHPPTETAEPRTDGDLIQIGDEGWIRVSPAGAERLRAQLAERDPSLYWQMHADAATLLVVRVREGELRLEPGFVAVFERLANHWLNDAPQRLIALIQAVGDTPLSQAEDRQRLRYFEGVAQARAGDYAQSVAVFDRLLEEGVRDEGLRGRVLNARAISCRLIARVEEAIANYEESLAIFRRLGDRSYEGRLLLNLGIASYELQQYAAALDYLTQATEQFTALGSTSWVSIVQNELGLVHRDEGRWDEAVAGFEHFIAQRQAEGAWDDVGLGLNNVGEVRLFQGRMDDALAAFKTALDKMETPAYQVDAHLNAGLAHQVTGDLDRAQASFRAALDLARAIQRRDIQPTLHYRLGDVLAQAGATEAATVEFTAAADLVEETRIPLSREELKISLLGRWQQIYERLILHHVERGDAVSAFVWAERSRARAFAEAVHSAFTPQGGGAPSPATLARLQAALTPADAVLCYFTTGVLERDIPCLSKVADDRALRCLLVPARTLLFVITHDRVAVHTCPVDPNLFVVAGPRRHDPQRWLEPRVLARLRALLVDVDDRLGEAQRLFVVPHGPLHAVPFTALLSSAAGGDEGREPCVVYSPSATVLLHHLMPPPATPLPAASCLAVGYDGQDPDMRLKFAEREATVVSALVDGQSETGADPKKERLPPLVGARRWLHFACHGWFDYEQPLASYLETGPGERLTAREVMERWKLQADLVTLSACRTGNSRILRSDEPMGLMRAFLTAGAAAVLVTQWMVDDLATFLCMTRFYALLARDAAADLSLTLRQAQRWLRQLTVAETERYLAGLGVEMDTVGGAWREAAPDARPFADPQHWAGFILVGRPQAGRRAP